MAEEEKKNDVDIKKVTGVLSFIFKYWHILSIVIAGAIGGYNQWTHLSDLEKKHDPEQAIAQSYYRKFDSLGQIIRSLREHDNKVDSRLDADDTYIDHLYDFKVPYGKWGNQ